MLQTMLLILLKLSFLFLLSLVLIKALKNIPANVKQKIILITLITSLILPFLSFYPLTLNLNKLLFDTSSMLVEQSSQNHNTASITGVISQDTGVNTTTLSVIKTEKRTQINYFVVATTLIWFIGILIQLFKHLSKTRQLKLIIIRSYTFEPKIDHGINIKGNQHKTIKILISDDCKIPFLYIHYSQAFIVLPKQASELSKTSLNHIIAHELCHYRRKDHWSVRLSSLVAIVYWFHPLLLRLLVHHKQQIELACDQQLISEGIDARSYAKTLLLLPQVNHKNAVVPMMAVEQGLLKQRIQQILEEQPQQIKWFHIHLIAVALVLSLLSACTNNNSLLTADKAVEFISHDLLSLRSKKLKKNHLQIATFYDGKDEQNTFVELEFVQNKSKQTTWLKLGPLKKFNQQIQTWHYKAINNSEITGRYKVTNAIADGSVDGVAFGIIYTNNKGVMQSYRSVGPFDSENSNVLCAWPLDFSNATFNQLTPQLSKQNHESIKRMLCGSQLLKNGTWLLK